MVSKVPKNYISKDILILMLSVSLAIFLVQTRTLSSILATVSAEGFGWLGSVVAGVFFTSIFTTAPAIVALGNIAQVSSVFSTAIFGAVGAVIGDLVLFYFIRDRFSEHLMEIFKHRSLIRRFHLLFKLRLFKWITFLIGGLIIASPLPDELGISLLGFTKVKTSRFILISFVFNFIGIALIGLAATSVI